MTSFDHLAADVRSALERDLTIDITTIGRRTGEPRRIEIWFLNIDGAIYIAGTPGPRDWLANLAANPDFTFHLKESTTADLAATATLIADLGERRRVFEAGSSSWYRNQGDDFDDLVATSPMVRVEFPVERAG